MAPSSKEFLYGLNPCFEALRAGRRRFYDAFINETTKDSPRLKKLAELLQRNNIPISYTDKGRLTQLCGSDEHQGAVIRSGLYPYVPWESLFDDSRLLLLDNVEDPHNVGAILRSAEIFGFSGVFLPLKGVPEVYPSVVKVSAGAAEFMRIARERDSNRYTREAKERGYKILALDAHGKSELDSLGGMPGEKILLVVGGEDRGVGQFILNMADHIVSIEQCGKVNSLNASVAAGIAMHSLRTRGGSPAPARQAPSDHVD
jgi:23S rRNA (guanosine2251-2'-O)-methyltransferase